MSTTPTEGSAQRHEEIPRRSRRALARMLSATPDAHPVNPSGFSCAVVHAEEQDVVELCGELDLAGCSGLQATLDGLTAPKVVIDLSQLTFLDAKGLSVLQEFRLHLTDTARTLDFRGGSACAPIVRRMITLTDNADLLFE